MSDGSDVASALVGQLSDEELIGLGAHVNDEIRRRAVEAGDREAVIADGFENGFGRDGLAVGPWISGPFVVCPGGLVAKGRASHRCRFVSVDDVWVWESAELIHEEKRASPGSGDGFRAVALLPVIDGMELDLVSGRLRAGSHSVERVVSHRVGRGDLIEVSQRAIGRARLPRH